MIQRFLFVFIFLFILENKAFAQGVPHRLANISSWVVGLFFIWALFKITRIKNQEEDEDDLFSYEDEEGPLDQLN